MKILLVDDDAQIRNNLRLLLTLEGHEIFEAEDGEAGLAQIERDTPELIFSDLRMPKMDGLAMCKLIKDNEDWKIIPVIFVSGVDSIEARLEAYEAGAEDFIVKPFQSAEVLRKVCTATRILQEAQALRAQANNAQSAAFTAMRWAAEIGNILEFMRASLSCETREALATQIRNTTNQFGLDAAVQIRGRYDSICQSSRGRDIPLDLSVMNHVRLQERIFEFHNRSAFNYDKVTLIINNMPLDDVEQCGRLRDHLALLAEAADARNRAIELEEHKHQQAQGLNKTLAAAESSVHSISDSQRDSHQLIQAAMEKLQLELSNVFLGCGLKESQEASIIAVFEEYQEEMTSLLDVSRSATQGLEQITCMLASLSK
jgi:DNA-binding response OmpR family regulator